MKDIAEVVSREPFEIGVITTPAGRAQQVVELAIEAGVKGILNFAPVILRVPGDVVVEYVDFTLRLDSLSYYLSNRS
jgi:redox-sensing transcriptional repressor